MNTKIILSISLAINVFAAGFFIGSLNKDVITNPVVEVQATETNLTSSKNNDTSSSLESNISITGLTYYAELCDGSICYTELDETVAAFQSQGYDPILNYESDSLGGHIVVGLWVIKDGKQVSGDYIFQFIGNSIYIKPGFDGQIQLNIW